MIIVSCNVRCKRAADPDIICKRLILTNRDFLCVLESELEGALDERLSLVHLALPDELAMGSCRRPAVDMRGSG